jgi:hypothetical protein
LNILFLGRNSGTSIQRKDAMLRLGHQVIHIDPHALLPSNRAIHLWEWHTGAIGRRLCGGARFERSPR